MVKVRIAPSPTGNLHIGTARTALFNWLFAKHHGGKFILRVEDTDLERSDKKYEANIIDGLKWLGLDWDGDLYRQSERLDIYRQYLEKLLESGRAFWCHHTIKELEAERGAQMAAKEPPRHLCADKGTDKGKKKGEIIRLDADHVSERKIRFNDSIRGLIEWEERLLGDISLAKDLNTPLYNLAVVVDDIEMGITNVIRGEDHISNTPKQILIYDAVGAPVPQFAHLPLVLAPDKSKLSKRHGATSVDDYMKDYLPEAVVNFLGFLGYTYSREIMSLEEMAKEFDLAKVHKSGAVFNIEKLNWLNAQYVRKLPPVEFKKLAGLPELPDAAVSLVTERLEKLSDASGFEFFWLQPEYDSELLKWKDTPLDRVSGSLDAVRKVILASGIADKEEFRRQLDNLGSQENFSRGLVYWPLRVALTGRKASPDPVDIASVLGKDEVLKRIDMAMRKLTTNN